MIIWSNYFWSMILKSNPKCDFFSFCVRRACFYVIWDVSNVRNGTGRKKKKDKPEDKQEDKPEDKQMQRNPMSHKVVSTRIKPLPIFSTRNSGNTWWRRTPRSAMPRLWRPKCLAPLPLQRRRRQQPPQLCQVRDCRPQQHHHQQQQQLQTRLVKICFLTPPPLWVRVIVKICFLTPSPSYSYRTNYLGIIVRWL